MANYRLLVAVVLLLLIFSSSGLLILNGVKSEQLEQADQLSGSVYNYLRLIDERCRTSPTDYDGIDACLNELIDELEQVGDLEEEDFENYDAARNQTGHLIIINEGRQSLDSNLFRLLLNKQVVDEGCVIEGSIDPGYACRLNFDKPCTAGDVLEVRYDRSRAYLKTC